MIILSISPNEEVMNIHINEHDGRRGESEKKILSKINQMIPGPGLYLSA